MSARIWAWLANQGLQRRIQLLTVIGLLIIFVFLGLAGQRAVEESTQQTLNHQLIVATLVASLLEYRLNTVLTLLETTAAQPELALGEVHPPTALLRDTQLRLSAYGRRLYWLDPHGIILHTEPFDADLISRVFHDLATVHVAMDEGIAQVSNLCRPSTSSSPYVLLAVPVFNSTGTIDSLLVEEIGAGQLGLQKALDQVAPDRTARIEVVDHEGNVLASSIPHRCFTKGGTTDRLVELFDRQQPVVGQFDQGYFNDGGGGDEIIVFVPLTDIPWGVTVRQPVDEVMAPVNHLRRQIFVGGGVILVAALLITSWFIRRQVLVPIQTLNKASAQMASGKLDVPIPQHGIDEVAHLTANLEQMRVRLEATLEGHHQWNEALEEMVEERTHELTTLYEQLEGKDAMCKQLLGKVLTAQEEERTRLARELHDIIGQSFTAIIMTTAAVETNLPADFESGKQKLADVRGIATQALKDLRRLIFNLRPETLDDLGLALALRSQAKEHLESAGVQVQLKAAGLKDTLPAEVEIAVFRVVQEAITNIARHAQASKANISLTREDGRLIVRVEDDGVGFDVFGVMNGEQSGWGLRGMRERIMLLGGEFYIGPRPDHGTLVLAEIPLNGN